MKNHRRVKILIIGGHITPALAVIENIRQRFPDWQIIVVGRRFSLEGERFESEEVRLTKKYHLTFFSLTSGRLTRFFSFRTILSLLKVPVGILQAFRIVVVERPTAILSFGGYIAFPVVLVGWCLKIPMLTHEQTRAPGLTNRIIAHFATRVCVSFEELASEFPPQKTVYTDLPLRSGIFKKEKIPSWMQALHLPLLYITGGSTGSVSLNNLFFPILEPLLKKYMVIHQVGRLSYDRARGVLQALPQELQARYRVLPYIDLPDYAWVLQHADLIVGRSGANTTGEVAALGKIALWIPLPWSSEGEQWANAQFLSDQGSSIVLRQSSLTQSLLNEKIDWMIGHRLEFQNRAQRTAKAIPRDGAARVVRVIEEIVLT